MYRFIRNPDPRKKPPFGSIIDPVHPLSKGLTLRLLLNELGGNKVFDISGHGNHGALVNGPYWTHLFSGGVYLDGSNDQIEVESSPSLRTPHITINAWFTPDSLAAWAKVLSYPYDDGDIWDPPCATWNIGRWGTGSHTEYEITQGPGSSASIAGSIDHFNDQSPHMITMTADGNVLIGYVNGIFDGDDNCNDINYDSSNPKILFGNRAENAPGERFHGQIHSVSIYNRALSAGEVQQLYAEPYINILTPQYWNMVDFGAAAILHQRALAGLFPAQGGALTRHMQARRNSAGSMPGHSGNLVRCAGFGRVMEGEI